MPVARPTVDDTQLVFRDFAARIEVDGEPVKIYTPEYDEETKTATAWIASQAGKEYTVTWRRLKEMESYILGRLYLDGQPDRVAGHVAKPDQELEQWARMASQRVSQTSCRRFAFAQLETTGERHQYFFASSQDS